MEQSGLILQETFRSPREEQRRENFQREFGGCVIDCLSGLAAEPVCDQGEALAAGGQTP